MDGLPGMDSTGRTGGGERNLKQIENFEKTIRKFQKIENFEAFSNF